jgi:signal peptidase I
VIQPLEPETPTKNTFWHDFWEVIQTLLLALILYFAIDAVFARVKVDNISMENTLKPGDLLVVNKLAYKMHGYATGEVIVFHDPLNVKEDFIKRIIGTPGDTVSVHNGKVSVNGVVLQENYIREIPTYEGDWVVPADSLFVLGDNRNESSDSHMWGFVPLYDVVGRALFVYWPFNAIQSMLHPYN